MKHFLLPIITSLALTAQGQLVIDNATFFIGENAVVTVQGNLTTNVAIQAGGSGATRGKIQMKGASAQTITVNSATASIPRLEIDNTNHVQLAGTNDLRVDNQLDFTNGKLQLGARNILLPEAISITGAGVGKFIETNGAGEARQLMTANGSRVVPVGTGTHFNPTTVTTTGSTFGANAYIGVRSTGAAVSTPQRHPRTETFLNTAFEVTRSGVTGGTVNVAGTYTDGQIAGLGTPVEADLNGFFWDGAAWSLAGSTQNAGTNTIGANVGESGGVVYGMNKFVLANPTVFLQGPFDASTGLMRDLLRSTDAVQTPGNNSTNNLIPTSDPYRTASYSSSFPHVLNAVAETIDATVLQHKANPAENIVDWVFIQLRKASGPTTAPISQTRSALLRRDGRIVDIDGVSPLYFKNENAATNYVLTIRHRNHLSISINPASPLSLGLTSTSFDFSSTANNSSIMGTAGTHFVQAGVPSKNLIWAGNVSGNGFTRLIGSNGPGVANASDRDQLLVELSGSPIGVIPNGYTRGDINLNRITRLIGNNGPAASALGDGNFLLNILGGNQTEVRSQILPGN